MSFTLATGALARSLLGDPETEPLFSPESDVAAMLRFEAALAEAEASEGVIPPEAARAIGAAISGLRPDPDALAAGLERDGVAVPDLVRQVRAAVGEPHAAAVHRGATSQDVVDTSLVLRLGPFLDLLEARLRATVARLDDLSRRHGANALTGRTRMQDALPIRAADRLAAWRDPLAGHLDRLSSLRPRLLVVQFAGAVGTLGDLGPAGPAVRARLAARLGLGDPGRSWHSDRTTLVGFGQALALLAGSLGKIGQDVALMAMAGDEIRLSGGGGSSAMPHKRNPVRAEVLVALARQAAILAGGLGQALVHEQERSGAAWTLEWLLLPDLCLGAGAATRQAEALVGEIERIGRRPPR